MLIAAPGAGGRIGFATVSGRDVDIAASIGVDARPVNGSIGIDLVARSGSTGAALAEYLGHVTITSSGDFRLEVRKHVGGTESPIGSAYTVPDLSLDPAARYRVRFDVAGASPTRLTLKLWRAGTAEPAAWMIDATDGEPALQTPPATSGLRLRTLKTLVDQYFDAFSGPYRPELAMNVIGSSVTGVRLDQADPSAVRYALARGATMVRRSMGAWSLGPDENRAITSRLGTRDFQAEWVSGNGVIAWLQAPDPNAPWAPTWQAIRQALSLGANYLGWYVDAQTVRCDQIPKDLPLAELPEMTQCGVNGTTSVTTHPLAKLYPGTNETLEDYFQRRAGYRFYVSRFAYPASLAAGRPFALRQTWWQRGVGKLHARYYLRARLIGRAAIRLNVDGGLDAHRWPAGPSGPHAITSGFTVPAGTAPGSYTLELAVVDAAGKPAINLADAGKDTKGLADPRNDYGWYRVGRIRITARLG